MDKKGKQEPGVEFINHISFLYIFHEYGLQPENIEGFVLMVFQIHAPCAPFSRTCPS